MADFSSDVERVLHGATTVENVQQDVRGDLDKLKALIGDLVARDWQGSASGSFNTTMQEWQGHVDKLMIAMTNIAELLKRSGHNFSMTNREIENNMKLGVRDYGGALGPSPH